MKYQLASMGERIMLPPKQHFQVVPWHRREFLILSEFDIELRNKWNDAMKKGLFLHKVESEPSRISGKRNFVAVLCRNRANQKRKPQSFMKLIQEINPNSFNFTKVKENEILFDLDISSEANDDKESVESRPSTSDSFSNYNGHQMNFETEKVTKPHLYNNEACIPETSFIINNSPYEFAHSLLVPDLKKLYMQSITLDAIRLGIEILLKSSHPGFRLMYNSLCAGASVNHLHLHCYYTEYWLNSEAFRMLPLKCSEKTVNGGETVAALSDCFELDFVDSCVRGFGFVITKDNYSQRLPNIIFRIVQYFNDKNIPHNLVMIRGLPPNMEYCEEFVMTKCSSSGEYSAIPKDPNIPLIEDDNPPYSGFQHSIHPNILKSPLIGRVYIFPRLHLLGEKCYRKFLVNVTELFGHLYFGDVDVFNSMKEDDVVRALNSVSLTEKEFEDVKADVIEIISQLPMS